MEWEQPALVAAFAAVDVLSRVDAVPEVEWWPRVEKFVADGLE